MTFDVHVQYSVGEDVRKVRAFVEADDLATAAKVAATSVSERVGKAADSVSGKEIDGLIVLIGDGKKPVWLKATSDDIKGQTTIDGEK